MKYVAVIPARYKSSRFPGKPLADIFGKPMVWWVYQQCLKTKMITDVYVATDDERIYEECKKQEMNVIMTSSSNPTGTDRVAEASYSIEGDVFINVQGDEPIISPQMIDQLAVIFEDADVYYASLMNEITDDKEIKSPNVVKVVTDKNGYAMYFSRSVIPSNIKDGKIAKTYRHVGIYAYKKDFLKEIRNTQQSELELGEGIEPLRMLELGYKIKMGKTTFSSIGVDTPEDLERVKAIMRA